MAKAKNGKDARDQIGRCIRSDAVAGADVHGACIIRREDGYEDQGYPNHQRGLVSDFGRCTHTILERPGLVAPAIKLTNGAYFARPREVRTPLTRSVSSVRYEANSSPLM